MEKEIYGKDSETETFITDLIDEFLDYYKRNKLEYIGISLIEKDENNDDFCKVKFSLCCYDDSIYNINAFKNIIYKEKTNKIGKIKRIDNFLYLKYFLNIRKLPRNLYKKLYKISDNNKFIVFFSSKKSTFQTNDFEKKFFQKIENCIKENICNNYEMEGIKENEVIAFIFDIKRPSFDKRKYFEKMNVIIDKFVIKTIKDIAYKNHFTAINHTGDGFIMIYRGKNLKVDFENILNSLEEIKNEIFSFFETLVDVYKEYRIRGILSKIKIYELKIDNSSYFNTIYMSSDLDGLFKKMKSMKKMEEEYFYNVKNENKKFFIIIDLEDEICNDKVKIENIKICGI